MSTFVVWLVVIWGTFNLKNAASQKNMHAHEDLGGGGAADFTKAAPHIEDSTEPRGAAAIDPESRNPLSSSGYYYY
jgi:hypothetical protein